MNIADQVREKLAEMEVALNSKTPNLPILLRTIHAQLLSHEILLFYCN